MSGGRRAPRREPTEGEIRLRAYRIWQWLGGPEGYEDAIWARAERELRDETGKAHAGRTEPTTDDPVRGEGANRMDRDRVEENDRAASRPAVPASQSEESRNGDGSAPRPATDEGIRPDQLTTENDE